MIIGNPDEYAILVDSVDEWNVDRSFNNGLLYMSIGGEIIPSKIVSATLNTELYLIIQKLEMVRENVEIYQMGKKQAFLHIYGLTFPDDDNLDNDYSYNITPYVYGDNNCLVFMVSNGDTIRVLASELQYMREESRHKLSDMKVLETFIKMDELQHIIEKAKLFKESILRGNDV